MNSTYFGVYNKMLSLKQGRKQKKGENDLGMNSLYNDPSKIN